MSAAEIRGAAAAAMDRGWNCFPVNGKVPATEHGVLDASRDFDLIEGWWPDGSDSGLALATGAPSGVWVLDLDGNAAFDALTDLAAKHGKIPNTVTARTARGWHAYFRHPQTGDVRNSAGKVGSGIDVRGTGGYVVLPPSPHPSGKAYEWMRGGRSPEEIAVAAAPAWLLALAAPPPPPVIVATTVTASHGSRYVQAAIEAECAELAGTPAGQRNDRLNRAAFSLARLVAAGEADAPEVARHLAAAASRAGLAPREIHRTIRSALTARGAA